MYEESEKILKAIKSAGLDPTIWSLLSLACVTLISASELTPQLKNPVKQIVGLLVDGNIELKSQWNDGILPIKGT